jgi:molecular chaperone GrpE
MNPTAADETDALAARLAEAERARDDYRAMAQATQADFENYQKRNAKEREDERKYWNRALAADLLGAIDNLDRALAAADAQSPLAQGVAGTRKALLDALARHGVTRMDVATGAPFNPNEHEAVLQQPSADVPAGAVTLVLAAGYRIHDRVLRPASVAVSAGPG